MLLTFGCGLLPISPARFRARRKWMSRPLNYASCGEIRSSTTIQFQSRPEMSDRLSVLNDVFRTVFDDETLDVDRDTTAKEVEGWDSLMHVKLVLAVEREFGVRFTSGDVASLKNVGELVDLVDSKLQP